ncbi:MAG TPA: AMED_5909 family protein [Actinophytocola sp.]|uniref:AMED_5909 family protein n=1 Tax=Actinophytocola sp. TaxID=1872138 RepID=UPI002DFEE53D|nr:AMED_5909 family protein [Actinophytocola sp.]
MSERPWLEARATRTLWAAHEALVALRPGADAGTSTWLNFHLRSSAVYRQVAEVDDGHHGEALYWAQREKAKADELAVRPAGARTRGRRGKGELASMPTSLAQAHEAVSTVQPSGNAPLSVWLAYHRHAAEVYAETAEVDWAHHHEARHWMSLERAMVSELERQIANNGDKQNPEFRTSAN